MTLENSPEMKISRDLHPNYHSCKHSGISMIFQVQTIKKPPAPGALVDLTYLTSRAPRTLTSTQIKTNTEYQQGHVVLRVESSRLTLIILIIIIIVIIIIIIIIIIVIIIIIIIVIIIIIIIITIIVIVISIIVIVIIVIVIIIIIIIYFKSIIIITFVINMIIIIIITAIISYVFKDVSNRSIESLCRLHLHFLTPGSN
ncbi:hypothetical protein ElyMa_001043700 [Elysia marginata]|uniref:ABC transmembrane type-1 domain-containing protein n=1 Tax=Elysia marginata TaxID=1093978 RepID=A0AAV4HMP6_9GAST|nr:hypothetical protein ElyMa_001043700 [Elysia marginata]